MKAVENTCLSKGICKQLRSLYDRIDSLTDEIINAMEQKDEVLVDEFTNMRMQELEQAQRLTLALTELIVEDAPEEVNGDESEGSVFAEGELTDNLGDKTEDKGEEEQ